MKKSWYPVLVVLALVMFVLSNAIFVVQEGTRAIKLRFNKVVRDGNDQVSVYQPGIHIKIPVMESIVKLDARLQTLDDQADRFLTVEKKDVLIDSYVKWRIVDFGKFYTTTGGQFDRAEALLRRKINDRLRSEVGTQTISDIVSGTRTELMAQARVALNNESDGASTFGIEVVDVRVNKIELPEEVSNSIYQRMRAERMAVAGEHRAQGQEEAQKITAETDRNVAVILANARLEAQKIRANADAVASGIYNETYAKNPELFNFVKTIESYAISLQNNNSILLVKPGNNGYYSNLLTNDLAKTSRQPNPTYQVNVDEEKDKLLNQSSSGDNATPAQPATPAEPAAPEATPAQPAAPAQPATPAQPAQPASAPVPAPKQ